MGLESLMSRSSRSAGECRAESTRLAGWSGERAIADRLEGGRVGHDRLRRGVL